MPLSVFLPLLLLVSTWSASANRYVEVQRVLSRNNEINSVEFLGTSEDGKGFFKDASNSSKTWQESRAFCESFKLTMLTVTSKLQLDFLFNAHKGKEIPLNVWTFAREDRTPIMMKWDNDEGKPDMFSFTGFSRATSESELPYQLCGVLGCMSGYFYIHPCALKLSPVCQIPK